MRIALIILLVTLGLIYSQVNSNEDHATTQGAPSHASIANTELNYKDCLEKFESEDITWCEIKVPGANPSIMSVAPAVGPKTFQVVGPTSVLVAWNSSAYDADARIVYFMGGGHADYGGNEVYSFDLDLGQWERLTDPSPLDHYTTMPNGDSFWIPDTDEVPGSFHTYDGLLFVPQTKTILAMSYAPANGAKFVGGVAKEKYIADGYGPRQYEFNPSKTEVRNGLLPLEWRLLGKEKWFYPRSAVLPDNTLIIGSKTRLYRAVIEGETLKVEKVFSEQADFGDGTLAYDGERDLIWSMHRKVLLAYDNHGKEVRRYSAPPYPSKSISFDSNGRLVCWDGVSKIAMLDPEQPDPKWSVIDWSERGPTVGDIGKVYEKWIHLGADIFLGISSSDQGVWLHKLTDQKYVAKPVSSIDLQSLLDEAAPGSEITIPPGNYAGGLRVEKPIVLNLEGVQLMGVAENKGILALEKVDGKVVINDFSANGLVANATSGNLAAIRISGIDFDVHLNRVSIQNTVMGVLTDNRGGRLVINDSIISDVGGAGDPGALSHAVYAGSIDELVVRNTDIISSHNLGHLIKSRSLKTTVSRSSILGLNSRHSRVIDLACGGALVVEGSVLQSSSNSDNADMISVGVESEKNCGGRLLPGDVYISNSILVFDRKGEKDEPASRSGPNLLLNWRTNFGVLELTGNTIVNPMGLASWSFRGREENLSGYLASNNEYSSRAQAKLNPIQNTRP